MNCARLACVAGTLGFLVSCSGAYRVGDAPANNGGSAGVSGGSGEGVAGTATASAGDATGGRSAVGGGGDTGADDAGAGPSGGAAGRSPTGGAAGAPAIVYCGETLPTSTPAVAFATPQVVWNRVQLFLLGASVGSPPMLPATTTRVWAAALVDSTLDSINAGSAPGLSKFVSAWWPGTPNADSWAAVLGDPKATLTDLLTSNVVRDPGSGVLTDPAVLTLNGIPERGKFVDIHLLCLDVPEPPPGIPPLPPAQLGQTRRELLEQAMAPPNCSPCHNLMNPIGFSLEHYDSVGAFNSLDNGSPIDSSGTLLANGDIKSTITFADVNELGQKLAQDCGVSQCLTQQLLASAESSAKLPRVGSTDPQVVAEIGLDSSSGTLRDLIRSIVESDTFLRAK